ncbi:MULTISPECIES: MarR family winged helix-turn-helix transcriptional regulator [unclassified Streptomyces]|uniref:MarR family winged helix-turn-helix transcriptional regulator n=1 Tax=unclassified Streptomyces TaxID=2593676 RepID=UPI00363FE7F5
MAAARSQYAELSRQLSAVGAVKRSLARILPADCPGGSAAALTLLERHGEMRMSRLAELLAVDMSVTSRHVAHAAERGWIERLPDPADKRSRILRLTPPGRELLGELDRRVTEMFARTLDDWTDDEVGQLNALLARLRSSFGDCRDRHEGRYEGRQEGRPENGRPYDTEEPTEDPYARTPTRQQT